MSAFHFSKYFKKNESSSQNDQTGVSGQTVTETSSVQPASPPAAPYSGIGNPPGGQAYSGIGVPPQPGAPPPGNGPLPPGPLPPSSGIPGVSATAKSTIDMNKRVGMDVLSRLTQRSNQVLMAAVAKAKELKLQYIDTEHVLWSLLHDSSIYQIISECKATPSDIQAELEKTFKPGTFAGQPHFSPRVKRVLELSLTAARSAGYEFISPEHVLLALAREGEGLAARTLAKYGLRTEVLSQKVTGHSEDKKEETKGKQSSLEQFAEDLTAKAAKGEIDPVVGRSAEIERVVHILSRRTKNNPVIIGEAGVGKTAIVEGLAIRIAHGDVPESLLNKRIMSLDLMSLIAGASHRGEFEERLKNLIKEVKAASGGIILFIDEIHNMVGAGSGGEGTMDASNILKPSLARGELQTIGTTTITEYRKYIEKDPALERRFQPVLVAEPSIDQAIEMLRSLRDKYEAFHRVKINDEAIEAAVMLSQRYVGDRFLPDKAVDCIDEAAAAVRLPAISLPENIKTEEEHLKRLESEKKESEKIGDSVHLLNVGKEMQDVEHALAELKEQYQAQKSTSTSEVTPQSIQAIISRWTGIPISKMTESESTKLMELENIIHKRLIDQESAVSAVAEAVRRGRAGLKSNKRPIGSFIFMGPTGVGKTELAKTLAETIFGSEEVMIRFDMTEYMEKHEAAKLIGAPPGYVGYEEGGQLTEAVRRHPYSVVLFDEIEKAHPDVFNILIQLLDDGRLTDNKGHTISFKNTIVVCTSNLGSGIIQDFLMKNKDVFNKKASDGDRPEIGPDGKPKGKKKTRKTLRTYTISPTGREIMTLYEKLWEKNAGDIEWKKGTLEEYFAGSVVTEGEQVIPGGEFDTHLIAPDGSETVTQGERLWFRTSSAVKEWKQMPLLSYFKDHTVTNALPDKPNEQLPTAKIDSHAITPTNSEIITLGDRFWKRENLATKQWTTGVLKDYFQGFSLTEVEESAEDEKSEKQAKAQSAVERDSDKNKGGNLFVTRHTPAKAADSGSEGKEPASEPKFPVEQWDVHVFKPTGEELVITDQAYWMRKNVGDVAWMTGSLSDLFTVTSIADAKEGDRLPIGHHVLEDTSKEEQVFAEMSNSLMDELRKFFRAELINRFDEVVVFRPLTRKHMSLIVDLNLKALGKLLLEQDIDLKISDSAREYLGEMGYDAVFGARPLRRTIQRLVENQISSFLIKRELGPGDTILIDLKDDELTFVIERLVKKKLQEGSEASVAAPKQFTYTCSTCNHLWQAGSAQEGEKVICPKCANSTVTAVEVQPTPPPASPTKSLTCNSCGNQWQAEVKVGDIISCAKCNSQVVTVEDIAKPPENATPPAPIAGQAPQSTQTGTAAGSAPAAQQTPIPPQQPVVGLDSYFMQDEEKKDVSASPPPPDAPTPPARAAGA